jgi:hypothetical protein
MSQYTMLSVEPVQEPMPMVSAMPDKLELKPERVQQQLARLLGWEEREGVGIQRSRKFASPYEAQAFAAFVLKVAGRRRQPVTVGQSGTKISITLQGRPGRGNTAGLTDAVYALACALG